MNRVLKSAITILAVPLAFNITVAVGGAGASVHQEVHTAHKTGHVGTTISISGAAGSKANITLVKIIDPAQVASQYISAPAGSRFVATEFKLVGTGANLFASADSTLSVTVTASNSQVYKSEKSSAYITNVTGCKNLANEKAAISRGQSVTGCVNFTLPTGITVSKVIYDEAGGSKGQWKVS